MKAGFTWPDEFHTTTFVESSWDLVQDGSLNKDFEKQPIPILFNLQGLRQLINFLEPILLKNPGLVEHNIKAEPLFKGSANFSCATNNSLSRGDEKWNKVSISPGQISPTQLWPTLRPELQLRLIQLLACLASNLISNQVQIQITSSSKIETEEVYDAT